MYYTRPPNAFNRFFLQLYEKSPRWAAPLAVLVCFLGAATTVWVMNPTGGGAFDGPTCIIKMTTGFDCPGCGGTRAFFYLLHGNIPAAARSHILLIFAFPYLAYMYVAWAVGLMFNKRLPVLKLTPKVITTFLFVWLGFSILRNLPWAPFTWFYV